MERMASVLERAVCANPADFSLRLHRLSRLADLWPSETQLREWRMLSFSHPHRPEVWRAFLRAQRSGLGPSVSSIASTTAQGVATLRDVLAGRLLSHRAAPGTEEGLMDLFCDFCDFLASCGHSERALGCWQFALEVNLGGEAAAGDLEDFWESGEARLGEAGALGWDRWRREAEPEGAAVSAVDEEGLIERCADRRALWRGLEELRGAAAWLPLHAGADCEDPERVVLFEDVSKVAGTRFSSGPLRRRLLLCCLRAFGLRHLGLERSLGVTGPPMEELTLFEGQGRAPVVRRLLDVAREAFPDQQAWLHALDELQFDFEASELPPGGQAKALKRFSRPLLARPANRNFLPLWRRYGAAEWRLGGGAASGRQIFNTALLLAPPPPLCDPAAPLEAIWPHLDLLTALADLEWAADASPEGLARLRGLLASLLGPGGGACSPTELLRVEKALQSLSELTEAVLASPAEASESSRWRHFCAGRLFADLCHLRLFCALAKAPDGDLAAPAHALGLWLAPLAAAEPALFSEAAQRAVDVLAAFARPRFLPRAPLHALARSLALSAPSQASSVRLLTSAADLAGPLRHLQPLLDAGGVPTWLAVLEGELERLARLREAFACPASGLEGHIRALFQRAVASPAGKHCEHLWRRFLRFEAAAATRAKGVFYRGLQKCPFSKTLLMEGAAVIPESWEEVADILTDREMRLRTPVEEVELLRP